MIPLGTSSGKPTLKRNVSALAIAREGEWLLFDCGEATQTQVIRAGLSPQRLTAIFITHLHGDHFNGLPGFLSTMGMDGRQRELTLIGPVGVREYLDTLTRLKVAYINYPLILREYGREDLPRDTLTPVYETSQYTVWSCPLDHRIYAMGYRVGEKPRPGKFDLERAQELGIPPGPLYGKLQSGQAIQLADGRVIHPTDVLGEERAGKAAAYCTDTRPCAAGVTLGREVDLLIHEATYTDDLRDEAHHYGHSTAAQSAGVASEASAGRLLLTHFSSRYADATPLLEEAQAIFPNSILAQDLLEIEV